MQPKLRPYQDKEDYWRVRQFLRAVSRLNNQHDRSWSVVRFDYWRWHVHENIEHFQLDDAVWLWENRDHEIVAVVNPDSRGEAFLQVHPALRTVPLEEEMIGVAQEHLAVAAAPGTRKLTVWANADDPMRQALLTKLGYVKGEWPEYQRRRPMSLPIANVEVPPGYCVRGLGDVEELPKRSYASWQAFHPNEPDERYEGWTWYPNVQRAPLYRRDLDIVAVAPTGEHAAFCTVWFDDVNRIGVFEPVGTAPAHQRRGLGKAVMCEGLRRLHRLGATEATVGSYSAEAGALYAAVGFTEYDLLERWCIEVQDNEVQNNEVQNKEIVMKILVVYDSAYGNTAKIAQAIGGVLGSAGMVSVRNVGEVQPEELSSVGLLIVGSPTQSFRPTPAITKLLREIPPHALQGVKVAAFDTRISAAKIESAFLRFMINVGGYAAKPIAKRLTKRGGTLVAPPEGFIVEGKEGPLDAGELERAMAWAKNIRVEQAVAA